MQIPYYESNVSIKPMDAGQMDSGLFQQGTPIKEVSDTLNNINEQFKRLRDVRETTAAETDFKLKLNDIETRAANDPDFDNAGKYQGEIDQAISEHSGKITNPEYRMKAEGAFRLNGLSTLGNIQAGQRKRQIEAAQDETFRGLGVWENAYVHSQSQADKDLAKNSAYSLIDGGVSAGVISAEKAAQLREHINSQWPIREADWDAENLPYDVVMAKMERGDYPPEHRAAVRSAINRKRDFEATAQKYNQQIAWDQNEAQAFDAYQAGQLTAQQVRDGRLEGRYRAGWADAMVKNLNAKEKIFAVTSENEATNLAVELGDLRRKIKNMDAYNQAEETAKFGVRILERNSQGLLSNEDTKRFTETVQKLFGNAVTRATVEKVNKAHDWRDHINNFLNFAHDTFAGEKSKVQAETVNMILDSISKDQSFSEGAQEIIERLQVRFNPNRTKYPVGSIVNTPRGPRKVLQYLPDGEPDLEELPGDR